MGAIWLPCLLNFYDGDLPDNHGRLSKDGRFIWQKRFSYPVSYGIATPSFDDRDLPFSKGVCIFELVRLIFDGDD